MHTEQAKIVNALRHKYEGTRPNSHEICTEQVIKLLEIFQFLWVFEIFETHPKQNKKKNQQKQVQIRQRKLQ